MVEPRNDRIVGRRKEIEHFQELLDPVGRYNGGRRPIMVVEGEHGTGKTFLLRQMAQALDDGGVPMAHIDLGDRRHGTGVEHILAEITSGGRNSLSHHRPDYRRIEFPRLWISLLVLRLDLRAADPGTGRDQVRRVLEAVRRRHRGRIDFTWLGDALDAAGDLIWLNDSLSPKDSPLAPLGEALPLSASLPRLLNRGTAAFDRVYGWFRTRDRGRDDHELDVLLDLNQRLASPWTADPVHDQSNRRLVDDLLCDALRADLRHAPRRVHQRATPTLLLDNAASGAGPSLLTALAETPPTASDEPLTIVAATRGRAEDLFAGAGPGTAASTTPADPADGPGAEWTAFSLSDLDPEEVAHLLRPGPGADPPDRGLVIPLWEFTRGHPGSTALLAAAAADAEGAELSDLLSHRSPDEHGAPSPSLEEEMLSGVLGLGDRGLPQDLLEAMTTCAAAHNSDAGLWLHRRLGPTQTVTENEILREPLWRGEDPAPTVLRRLLLRRLAARNPHGRPDWDTAHRELAGYYQERGWIEGEQATEGEMYHRLSQGDLTSVARLLVGRLSAMDGASWLRLLERIVHAPVRERPALAPDEEWQRLWREHSGEEDPAELEECLKLIAARWILSDPETAPDPFLHSRCAFALNALAPYCVRGQAHLHTAALAHENLARRFD